MKKDRYGGTGAILADDMGLGKTLQSITLMYSLLKNKDSQGKPLAKRCIVVCPCSLVKNWEDEFEKWINSKYDLGVPRCCGAFTSFKRVVSRNDGSGCFFFGFWGRSDRVERPRRPAQGARQERARRVHGFI
jgi:hypothetical protein